jgi:hypothetical protein
LRCELDTRCTGGGGGVGCPARAGLGDACVGDNQCPRPATCREGVCAFPLARVCAP